MVNLNRIREDLNRVERDRLNENFDIIERNLSVSGNGFANVQTSINELNSKVSNNETSITSLNQQIAQITVQGDSSVEAAAARVGYDNAVYPTLKNRIDSENLRNNNQLIQLQQSVTDLRNTSATVAEVQRLDAEKPSRVELQNGLATKSDTATVDDQLNGKVDINGNEQVGLSLLTQEVRTALTGGSVAVVGTNAVNTSNIVDNATTANKRTNIGELGIYYCFNGDTVDFDFANGIITIPEATNVLYRKTNYNVPQTLQISLNSLVNFQALYFNTETNNFTLRVNSNLATTTERAVLIALISFNSKSVVTNGSYSINGQRGTMSKDRTQLGEIGSFYSTSNTSVMNIDLNNRVINIPQQTRVVHRNTFYTLTSTQNVTIPADANSIFTMYFNVTTNTFSAKSLSNFNTITESDVLILVGSYSKREMYVANGSYSINGINIGDLQNKEVMYQCFSNIVNLDTVNRTFTIPQNTNIVVGTNHYTVPSDVVLNLPTNVNFSAVYYDIFTGTFIIRNRTQLTNVPKDYLLFAIINLNGERVTSNGPSRINGRDNIDVNLTDIVNDSLKIAAHRGWTAGNIPENTRHSFIAAKDNGFAFIEFDVRFTSDNIPVIIHDETLNRTARNDDGTALTNTINIRDITYQDALTYDFGIYSSADYANTRILTLTQALQLCRRLNIKPYLHLSESNPTEQQLRIVYENVRNLGLKRTTVYTLNSVDISRRFLNIDRRAKISVSTYQPTNNAIDNIAALKQEFNTEDVFMNGNFQFFTQEIIDYAHSQEVEFGIFTGSSRNNAVNSVIFGAISVTVDNVNVLGALRNSVATN